MPNAYGSSTTFGISEEERRRRNQALGGVEDTTGRMERVGEETARAVNPMYEQLYSPTGWKQTQRTLRTQSTNRAFDSARAAARQRANLAGFGYQQPVAQTGEGNVEIGRAAALSDIPGTVEAESMPITFQALAGRQASGSQYGDLIGAAARTRLGVAGEYSPESYYGLGAQQAEAEKQRRSSLWKNIAKIGLMGASAIPGVGPGVAGVMRVAGGAL